MQPTGATQCCFRCGLTNHSPDNCKYKDFECHRCHQKGHLRSECRKTKPPRPKAEGRQHVRLADQDAEGEAPVGGEDQIFQSIFNLDGAQSSVSQNSAAVGQAGQNRRQEALEDSKPTFEQSTLPIGMCHQLAPYQPFQQAFNIS
ncbi:uncharacterized protein [Montipora foliosa]|uniref:uncharacterized protein isoform X3 n=1 Tax=Montipora foliosa TaxID=591990 RepID=UPI0035F10CBB